MGSRPRAPGPVEQAVAGRVAALVPTGARVQVGPGRLGAAVLAELAERQVSVHVDSGLLPDAVVDLAARGLLLGVPVATYLAGSARLYDWADGRPLLHPVEWTHSAGRLGDGPALVAVNTALEVDVHGQVNVEGTAASSVGGIGGHPDYAGAAASSADGLSVIALASSYAGRPTLVEQLSRPATTAAHDVDVVVTERGSADLRGLSRAERTTALRRLWD
ncbi:acetyl-CoA hydrolase/transferase C-terminal domain-containing protein [Nocardioides humi]|uniref:acetyl-CoA hydrolase/transferase C-terminal domain-containing protein n=1 Tax=Nocardioides humi TaxID=449461 RepID=UPI001C63EAAB|nr:acetyl-CoA hydrolase/transferase C-terminal domain-containing protein [Nocardioides humi]